MDFLGQVMGGIAAEASNNGKAEGGQSDESALIQLLAGLDGGKSWDLPRVQNQARAGGLKDRFRRSAQ